MMLQSSLRVRNTLLQQQLGMCLTLALELMAVAQDHMCVH